MSSLRDNLNASDGFYPRQVRRDSGKSRWQSTFAARCSKSDDADDGVLFSRQFLDDQWSSIVTLRKVQVQRMYKMEDTASTILKVNIILKFSDERWFKLNYKGQSNENR